MDISWNQYENSNTNPKVSLFILGVVSTGALFNLCFDTIQPHNNKPQYNIDFDITLS